MKKHIILLSTLTVLASATQAQIFTREDSLSAGLVGSNNATVISGYGEVKYEYNSYTRTASANANRAVMFIGHRFNERYQLFSEWELENANTKNGGEFGIEQLFIKYNINRNLYITTGLFTPRIGIINENHLPTTFNSINRPFVETLIIPATWREIGVGLYGQSEQILGLNYAVSLTNGLDASKFENGKGIRGGRGAGNTINAKTIGITPSVLYYHNNFRIQASGYYGGSVGVSPREADSLFLETGPLGSAVAMAEANMQYKHKGVSVKALVAYTNITKAQDINRAYANNTPSEMIGGYAELGYNVLHKKQAVKSLTIFTRYEYLDLNSKVPVNGISTGTNKQQYIIAGVNFAPIRGVSFKAEYRLRTTEEPNPLLIVNPFPQQLAYPTSINYVGIGMAYAF
ncbi:MAG: hypothetical protein ABL940_04650 [Bacteroidia bacterium]